MLLLPVLFVLLVLLMMMMLMLPKCHMENDIFFVWLAHTDAILASSAYTLGKSLPRIARFLRVTNNSAKCAIVQQLHQFNPDTFNVKYCTNIQSVLIIVQGNRTLFAISLQCMHMHIQCILFRAFDCIQKKTQKWITKQKHVASNQNPLNLEQISISKPKPPTKNAIRALDMFAIFIKICMKFNIVNSLYLFIKFPYLIVRTRIVWVHCILNDWFWHKIINSGKFPLEIVKKTTNCIDNVGSKLL